MAIVDKLEDTLNGGYGGLYGEVVTEDCYKIRNLPFVPDIVYDLGANIGVFTRFAQGLWPEAIIVAVEPDPENCAHFLRFTKDLRKVSLLAATAIGAGPAVWRGTKSRNGAMECYISPNLGYPAELMEKGVLDYEKTEMLTALLPDFMVPFWSVGLKAMIKIDIEGAENNLFEDEGSMNLLRQMDYIAMELHFHALTGAELDDVKEQTSTALDGLKLTHECTYKHPMFYALKK